MLPRGVASLPRSAALLWLVFPTIGACAQGNEKGGVPFDSGSSDILSQDGDTDIGDVSSDDVSSDDVVVADTGFDLGPTDTGPLDPDAACATATATAKTEALPVDIIWVVDNSSSMQPAVEQVKLGLNDFAASIGAKSLDYKVIMLAIKSETSPITLGGGTRYPVCIPPPLAGDTHCGDGPRFHHSSVDIKSTQPLEQFLGTLAQTTGYKSGETRGSDPWADQLRPSATKTIVVVTDDESRLSATDFETFPGGPNPSNSALTLPPGILDPSWKGQFDGYVFSAIYGWGSETTASTMCTYSDGSKPASAGPTYTELVKKTAGARAKICDGATAWKPFFDAIATAVVKASKLSCDLAIPTPSVGTLDPSAINVQLVVGGVTTLIPKVKDAASCGTDVAWYYDSDTAPTKVLLCPAACDAVNGSVGVDKLGKIDILFGCKTISVIK